MTTITNLTPHPVTLIRDGRTTVYPACTPGDLPRAVEAPTARGLDLIHDDTQGSYGCSIALASTGVVDNVGYVGVEGLPPLSADEIALGCTRFSIVSIVTVLGAIAAGRPTCDLLVPMGQVRDAAGRIVGCTGLAPADTLLTPMAAALRRRWERSPIQERTAALLGEVCRAAGAIGRHQAAAEGMMEHDVQASGNNAEAVERHRFHFGQDASESACARMRMRLAFLLSELANIEPPPGWQERSITHAGL
jgi:hypothetical protein